MSEISQEPLPFLSLFVTGTVSQSFFSPSLSQWWAEREICLVTSMVPFPCSQECQSLAGLCTKAPGVAVGCCTCPYLTAALANGSIAVGLNPAGVSESWSRLKPLGEPSPLNSRSCLAFLSIQPFHPLIFIKPPENVVLSIWRWFISRTEPQTTAFGEREQHRAPPAGPAVKRSRRIQGMKQK